MKAALAGAGVEYRDRIVGQRRELTIRLAVVQVAGSKGRKTVRHASRVGSQNSSLGSHGEERDEEGQGERELHSTDLKMEGVDGIKDRTSRRRRAVCRTDERRMKRWAGSLRRSAV